MKKELTLWQASCTITGFGVGGGIMAMPYLTAQNGIAVAFIILIIALAFSLAMHFFVADLVLRGKGAQIGTVVSDILFRGKSKKYLTLALFILVGVVLLTTMAAYITGGGDILAEYLKIPPFVGNLIFYVAAASVVLFGLKSVGVSEGIAVTVMLVLIAALMIASFFNIKNPLPYESGGITDALGYFGMAMFCFTAFFAVPQAVTGLNFNVKKIKKAIIIGYINILVLILVVTLCSLVVSKEVTEVAMLGWSAGIGTWAQITGSGFIFLALLTTYWSVSLALADMAKEQLKLSKRVCWLIATIPTLAITLIQSAGFIDLMQIAGGAAAIILAFLVIPAVRKASKDEPSLILGKLNRLPIQIAVFEAYLLMAIGNLLAV
ncbi:MAG: hypothetical protein LBT30_06865 [Clostridiales bacterium]|jgi:amino acid permease|nr:hypothetical protein [Clostridiales bacterium]